MALVPVTEGATSSTADLNQVVNLLNGTTTNTQLTVRGGVAANLAGTSGYARFVGGASAFNRGPTNPLAGIYGAAAVVNTGNYTSQAADIAVWPGGPFFTKRRPDTSPSLLTAFFQAGTGGAIARMYQTHAATVSVNGSMYPMDTVSFDPTGMVQPFLGGSGVAITIPEPGGLYGICGAIHSSGVNANKTVWLMGTYTTLSGFSALEGLSAPASPITASSVYTGASFLSLNTVFTLAPGSQLCFSPEQILSSFSLDVTDSTRCYLSAWKLP